MKSEDKEAYTRWKGEDWEEGYHENPRQDAWEAACLYKQKEIDDLKNVTYWQVEQGGKVTRHISIAEIEKLQAKNEKLRECVEWYSNYENHDPRETDFGDRARQCLKELGEK